MAKGSKTGYKRNTRNKVQLKKKGSDESDEDYMVSEDEVFELSEDEYCSSLAGDESEEEEWFEKKPKKAGKPRGQKGFPGRKKNGVIRRRRKMVSYNEEEDDYEDDGFISVKESTKKVSSRKEKEDDALFEPEEEEEEDDYEDDAFIPVKESKKNVISRKEREDDEDEDLFKPEEEEEDDYEDDAFISVKERKKNVISRKEKKDDEDEDLFEPEEEEEEDYEDDGFISAKETKKNVIGHKVKEDDDYEHLFEQEKDEEEEDFEDDDFDPVKEIKENVISGRKKEDDDNTDLFEREEDEEEENYEDDDFSTVKESKKIVTSREEKENSEDLFEQEYDDFCDRKSKISRTRYGNGCEEKPRKKNRVSYREAREDSDSDDSDDEEFTPDEIDGFDDEMEETPVIKNRANRPRMQVTHITKGRRTKRNRKIVNRTNRKNTAKEQLSSKKRKSVHDNEFGDDKFLSWKKTKNTKQGTRRKKLTVNSDSDFVSSGPSDHEFTISEEEREQVREASEFCKRLRNSNPPDMIDEKETIPPERKRPVRKGKEKMVDLKIEVGKQVCGICLSEEGKRTVRGILNSCSHYFCFACIMEWSKVESRCPLCKQRFATITRTSRADGGLDSRDAVIAVPERDQVYQPSEEELRGYLDPYESVLCTECLQGGDDAHMLLCDLCDSPAHTYCVGLGHEVPDGNWYCDGCRPTVLASQAQTPTAADHRASNNSFVSSSPPVTRETFDLNEMYVPDTPLTQVSEPSSLSRNPDGDSFATSPTYGSGAFTLFERRRIQRQIHQLINARNRRSERSEVRNQHTAFASNNMASVSSTTLFGSQIVTIAPHNGVVPVRAAPERLFDQGRLLDYGTPPHNGVVPVRAAPERLFNQGRLSDYGTPLMYSREGIIPRFGSLRGQMPQDQGSTSMNYGFVGLPQSQFGGIEERIGGVGVAGGGVHQQLQPCSGRSNAGVGASVLPFQFQEATVPSRTLPRSLHPPF